MAVMNRRTTNIVGTVAILGLALPLLAVDRNQPQISSAKLQSPKLEHLASFMSALRGCEKCSASHTPAGDALVKLGKPAASPITRRLEGTTKWWIRTECVHLLGLIGPDAKHELPALEEELAKIRHPIPSRYGKLAVFAIRQDVAGLAAALDERQSPISAFALELLGRMGPRAKAALPALRTYLQKHPAGDRYHPLAVEVIERIDSLEKR